MECLCSIVWHSWNDYFIRLFIWLYHKLYHFLNLFLCNCTNMELTSKIIIIFAIFLSKLFFSCHIIWGHWNSKSEQTITTSIFHVNLTSSIYSIYYAILFPFTPLTPLFKFALFIWFPFFAAANQCNQIADAIALSSLQP